MADTDCVRHPPRGISLFNEIHFDESHFDDRPGGQLAGWLALIRSRCAKHGSGREGHLSCLTESLVPFHVFVCLRLKLSH